MTLVIVTPISLKYNNISIILILKKLLKEKKKVFTCNKAKVNLLPEIKLFKFLNTADLKCGLCKQYIRDKAKAEIAYSLPSNLGQLKNLVVNLLVH